ncbi:response regulator [Emcibacter nanhaiensis]|uniref:histidine kinase n=1 Tax=Emcibacter nanhaiensis TaxID=1505037 RepID=A0A501PRV8_9PROT|nr:response regulator [Emcibacter nanhaiensis]TPD62857.1 response regulator [Emcibacter nanhaiensis]
MNKISPITSEDSIVAGMKRRKESVDYPFLITLAGIGILIAMAFFILGLATGYATTGAIVSAVSVLLTAVVMGFFLSKENNVRISEVPASLARQEGEVPAYLLTSKAGEVIYADFRFRQLVGAITGSQSVSPFGLNFVEEEEKSELEDTFKALKPGERKILNVTVTDTEDRPLILKLDLFHESERQGYVRWNVSAGDSAESKQAPSLRRKVDLSGIGRLLELGNAGCMAVGGNDEILYVNDLLRDWLVDSDEKELQLPVSLQELTERPREELDGLVPFLTVSGQEIPLVIHSGENLSSSYGDSDVSIYVLMREGEGGAAHHMPSDVNIEHFFMDSPIGIAVVSAKGEVLERNNIFRNFLAALGLVKTKRLKDFLEAEDHEDIIAKIGHTIESGEASTVADVAFKGKEEKRGQLYITRLEHFADHEGVSILYLIDTTEQKSLELQFAQSQKMQAVGQLAGGIAHDFNNLLTAITGFCDLLLVRHGPGDQSFSDIIQIKQNANRAANLVRQLLAFSRQQTLRPKVLVVTDVLAELSNLLRRLIGETIELEMKHGRGLGPVKVDQGQLEQVIINLCVNARDAMPEGGKIMIRTRNIPYQESLKLSERYKVMPPNDYVLLEVEDTGTGIAKEHLGKIFEPFFSTKEVGKGTGLGLSTVYGIIKQTDGFIFPTSELGKGTTFSIYIPMHKEVKRETGEASVVEQEGKSEAKDLTGKGNILLVEDEDAVRMFASRALKNKGYKIYEANSGDKALKIVQELEGDLDLIISDVVMPQMDGPTMVKKVKEKHPNLKVIFISGYAEDAFDKNLGEEDFNFLPKPFSLKQLAEQVKDVLES